MKQKLGLLAAAVAGGIMVGGAGLLTNGLPFLVAPLTNGIQSQTNKILGQLDAGQLNISGTPDCCGAFIAVDTNLPGGASPQSVAATPFQVAMTLLGALQNLQTSTVHAATSNTLSGVIITEALTTAPGALYTFTLTNSQITAAYTSAGNVPAVGMYSISNTGGTVPPRNAARVSLVSATAATGSITWVFRNDGNTALNGTMAIGWDL
jgi:hypothetical protein